MNDSAPTSAPSSSANSPHEPREMGIDDMVKFVLESWRLALAGAIVVGGACAIWAFSQARTWESSASLLSSPPLFTGELKQLSFNMPSYQRLMESPEVIGETRKKLMERGVLRDNQFLKIGDNIETKLFMSKKGDDVALVPMIECRGRGESAAQAHDITAMWVQVFLERTKAIVESNTSPSLLLIENQYQTNQQKLTKLEEDNKIAASQFQRKQAETVQRWNETIGAFNLETNTKIASFQSENEKLLANLRRELDLPGIDARITAYSRSLSDLSLGASAGADHLKSVHLEKAQPLNRSDQVKQIAEQLTALQNQQLSAETTVRKFEREQQLKLEELKNQRTLALEKLTANQKQELDDLNRVETLRQAQVSREMVPLSATVASLATSYQQVQLAKAKETTPDISLASAPVLPEQPLPRGAAKMVGIAAFLGILLGLGVSFIRRVARKFGSQPQV
jgi:uncharacterized protein involved in exopolysaccharide biosynthesis